VAGYGLAAVPAGGFSAFASVSSGSRAVLCALIVMSTSDCALWLHHCWPALRAGRGAPLAWGRQGACSIMATACSRLAVDPGPLCLALPCALILQPRGLGLLALVFPPAKRTACVHSVISPCAFGCVQDRQACSRDWCSTVRRSAFTCCVPVEYMGCNHLQFKESEFGLQKELKRAGAETTEHAPRCCARQASSQQWLQHCVLATAYCWPPWPPHTTSPHPRPKSVA
jgi:hypothetical protein